MKGYHHNGQSHKNGLIFDAIHQQPYQADILIQNGEDRRDR